MATRGKMLEETLAKILTPEQLAKFEELRVRERENRIESRAQRSLAQVIEEIDLSPGQRDEVLARGGSRDAMESFVAFRGRAPQLDALLRHNGMMTSA